MIKINDYSDFKYFISKINFKKIFGMTWTVEGVTFNYSCLYILKECLRQNNIIYKLDYRPAGSLVDTTITFNTNEDEAHFILLVNSLKS